MTLENLRKVAMKLASRFVTAAKKAQDATDALVDWVSFGDAGNDPVEEFCLGKNQMQAMLVSLAQRWEEATEASKPAMAVFMNLDQVIEEGRRRVGKPDDGISRAILSFTMTWEETQEMKCLTNIEALAEAYRKQKEERTAPAQNITL